MWSAISRLFSKTNTNPRNSDPASDTEIMDRGEDRRRATADWDPQDTYDTRQAKQRASVKWLLSKAYNNRVPDNLREPFYRDHEDQEHLKPQVVHALASAELYCLALSNIYSDPNYHNLNHWGVLQALGRKGVFAAEPPDARLTETVLIQTTPLRLSAHLAVIEALMALYAKEVVTPDRVLVAVHRFGPQPQGAGAGAAEEALPADHEAGLLLWVNRAGQALRRRARQELDAASAPAASPAATDDSKSSEGSTTSAALPELPTVREWKELSNGVSLAALVSFYCPEELPWSQVVVGRIPTISDSMHNLMLVYNFCSRCLPSSVFHMMPEDVTYMQGSMKQNLIVFLADLFNVLEIHPVKCVRFQGTDRALWKEVLPRNSQGVAHKRSFPQSISAIPDLRSNLAPGAQLASAAGAFTVSKSAPNIQISMPLKKSHSLQAADIHNKSGESMVSQEDRRVGAEETFVVHRGRAVPTLATVAQTSEEPLIPARLRPAKEKQNQDSKAEERGEPVAAGRPSNWEEQRRSSYAGRRSRRNSVSDDSQLTLENFGGSQENLHLLGRNPDKEPAVHVGRKSSAPESPSPVTAVRSSAQDARSCGVEMLFSGSGDNGYYSGEKRDEEKPTTTTAAHYAAREPVEQPATATSFAELSRVKADSNKGINISYMQQEHESEGPAANNSSGVPTKSSFLNKKTNGTGGSTNGSTEKKTTTFAALPNNTTTWQQQSSNSQMMHQAESQQGSEDSNGTHVMASQLHNIRMKLEEKRRRIESEKRRMEVVMSKQRQKVGKAAFLQAVTKGKGSLAKGAEPESQSKDSSAAVESTATRPQRPLSLQEISEDASSVEHKWLDNTLPYIEERRTPDIENMDLDQYQQSLAQMNSSLHEIQADIQRLASQQHQIQGLHPQPVPPAPVNYAQPSPPPPQTFQPQPQPQFYLHEQQVHRRTWAPPEVPSGPFAAQDGRALWGSDRHQKPQPTSYNCQPASGFMLHDPHGSAYTMAHTGNGDVRYHNGEQSHPYHHHHHHHHLPPAGMTPPPPQHHSLGVNHVAYPVTSTSPSSGGGYQSFQLHHGGDGGGSPYTGTPPSASPVHRTTSVQQRISQMLGQESTDGKSEEKARAPSGVMHAPIPTPPVDDMEPQSISFIGTPNADEGLAQSIKGLQITSGSRTYRIPSPTRPGISRSAFHHHHQQQQQHLPEVPDGRVVSPNENHEDVDGAGGTEKGFYISFDNDAQPKRPKPPLRMKRSSPKKERPVSQHESLFLLEREDPLGSEPLTAGARQEELCSISEATSSASVVAAVPVPGSSDPKAQAAGSGVGLVIGTELLNPDPTVLDEMERKKEKIMLLSLQRRQQQEELKARKEQEAQRRRDLQKLRQEERERKKEEERLRRAAILEQYKLKKAIEEAEREGKLHPEKSEMMQTAAKPVPKLRNKSSTMRPRPKTIHVDSGSVQELQEGGLSPSRSKKGSTSNLTDSVYSAPMKRDYYRGSQDSLADRLDDRRGLAASLFKDSPDDGRGASPCRSVNQLGRRGSYKTSRDTSEPRQTRGRQKYPTYQGNFRGRKSNSLMNLCGSSTDQDSMVYRYADTDSGLGRATPPRRAPSPGMSSMRHLPSPSGPGSLPPGLMTKRRMFDDGSSDISSTPSSMMEYTGPRLYKQPATKSNRGIMLNAVEYCVFPGAVNKEAKRRVLEEIARSESKHFLILFRDAGCQFRALYAYCPEREDVAKLYGTGPKQITDRMFDKFFKYNSGGKCFSQVHTKHLTVTIDAFTIHNSLWQGKKVALPNKKDMPLVI